MELVVADVFEGVVDADFPLSFPVNVFIITMINMIARTTKMAV